nr:DUF551 domain-containing protein [Klebsiella quasipneumoniae]
MTNNQLTDERVTSVIERLEHCACNLKWTNVRGAQDLLTAADGLRELQERCKADSEPVILYRQVNPANGMKTYWAELDPEEFRHLKKYTDENAEFMTLYRHAQPVPEYPEVLPCSVLLEPGLRFGKGIKTSTMLAALARRAVHESDLAALSPEERAEFQARIEDFKALIAQPAPVVPEVDADDNFYSWFGREWAEYYQHNQYTTAAKQMLGVMAESAWKAGRRAAMLAAAPQSPGGDHATVPGKWIPVSERMPEVGDIVLTAMGGAVNVGEMECSAANCRFFTSVISGRELPATHWMPLPAGPKEDIKALIPLVSRNEQEGK